MTTNENKPVTALRITPADLRHAGACDGQVDAVATEWPDGVRPTLAVCRRAVALGLSLGWAAEHLLTAEARRVYDAATAEARRVYDAAMPATWLVQEAKARVGMAEAFAAAWLVQEATARGVRS